MLPKSYDGQDCSLARALEVVGERWTLLVLRDAFYGIRHFSDFQTHLGAPRAVLSERLRTLVEHGLLTRRPDPGQPSRPVYALTDKGRALWPALHALRSWGEQHAPAPGGPRRVFVHDSCGGELDATSVCGTCRQQVGPEQVLASPGPGLNPGLGQDAVSTALTRPHRLGQPLTVLAAAPHPTRPRPTTQADVRPTPPEAIGPHRLTRVP
ncbi:MAG: ArsR family transcriptional regulator [Pseudonocardiales bacterium]|nr:MAG: ArsR family transcriptional regulator [Pseudonocardiales bacterium]